jgi:hypothetical protein
VHRRLPLVAEVGGDELNVDPRMAVDLPLCLSETPGFAGERLGAKGCQPCVTPALIRAIGYAGATAVL